MFLFITRLPRSGFKSPISMCSRVVFPDPVSPIIATLSPSEIFKLKSFNRNLLSFFVTKINIY